MRKTISCHIPTRYSRRMRRNPSLLYVFKTAAFRLRNPSAHKAAMLRDAMLRSHRAYSKLLERLLPQVDRFAECKKGAERDGEIGRRAAPLLRPLPLSCAAKAGVMADLAGQLSSFIELKEAGTHELVSAPSAGRLAPNSHGYCAALDELAAAVDLETENVARNQLQRARRAPQRRPLFFTTFRRGDGFLLLRSPANGRLYAWLNLHPKESRFARPVTVTGLVDARSGQAASFTSKTGALFPLAFGRAFQVEQFLERGRPRSAKLVERDGVFELQVAFEFAAPKVATACRIGVDRGIYNLASLSVVDDAGRVLADENLDGRQLRHVQRQEERRQGRQQRQGRRYRSAARRHHAKEAVHVAANAIVAKARLHGAQAVVESLAPLATTGRRRARSGFNRLLGRAQYQKLGRILAYKLALVGLPPPLQVSASFTSQICPCCGHRDRQNRAKVPATDGFKLDRFRCVRCGYAADADLNAARIIALKRQWREGLPTAARASRMSELPPALSFESFLRDRAAMRGEGPCGLEAGTSGGPGLGEAGPDPAGRPADSLAAARTPWRTEESRPSSRGSARRANTRRSQERLCLGWV